MKDEDSDFKSIPLSSRSSGSRTNAGGKENSRRGDGAKEKASSKRETKAQRKARAEQKKAFETQREEKMRFLWDEFNTLFPTDGDCLRALCFGYDLTDGVIRCFYCNNQQAEKDFLGRNTVCVNCGHDIWYTADGPFRGNKKPRAWLAHIWLMGKGMMVCSSAFHRLVGVAQSTAADIFKAVTHRVLRVMDSADLDSVMLASARFIETFIRRSDQTPRLAHPSEEQLVCEQDFVSNSVDTPEESQSDLEDVNSSSSFQEPFAPQQQGSPNSSAADCSEAEPHIFQDIDSLGLASSMTGSEGREITDSASLWNARFAELVPLTLGILEQTVLSVLSSIPQHFESICQLLGAKVSEIAAILTVFEMEGLVCRHSGDRYSLGQVPWLGSSVIPKNERVDEHGSLIAGSLSLLDGWISSSSSSSSSHGGNVAADGASVGTAGRQKRPSLETEIGIFHRFIQLIYQGISRKYLCHYLAGYWIQMSERWRGDSLLRLMQARGPVLRDEIQASVVPLLVRFPCLETAEQAPSHELGETI